MTQGKLYDQILGSLALAGMGDALGASTEQWTMEEIATIHGPLVTAFTEPPEDTFAGANHGARGEVTDDASQMYHLAQALIRANGRLDQASWIACLLDWADTSPKAGFMGPSTAGIVQALRDGTDPALVGIIGNSRRKMTNFGITNGAAMRVAPAGLIHPGDLLAACEQAFVTCLPSHDTDAAVSSACAIAAGVARALVEPSLDAVIEACLEGGHIGVRLARERARMLPGPRFLARLELALAIARREKTDRDFLVALDAAVGASVLAAESVPAAIAILAYAEGDPLRTIALAASIGNDTDSIATMAGALAGAIHGAAALPQPLYGEFLAVNAAYYRLDEMAAGLTELARANLAGPHLG